MLKVNQTASQILFKEMGVIDTFRFFNQFDTGTGDYTQEREQWLGNLTLEQIVSEIKANRQKSE
jgi:hypothetical protein